MSSCLGMGLAVKAGITKGHEETSEGEGFVHYLYCENFMEVKKNDKSQQCSPF